MKPGTNQTQEIKNKAFALILGVTGMGIISQLTNLITFFNFFIPLGVPNGLSKFVAEINISEREKLNKLLFSSISLIFFPAIVLSVLVFLISDNVSYFLFENYEYTVQVKIVSAAIPFIVLNTLLEGYLRGLKIIKVYVKVVIISNIINIVVVVSLLLAFGLNGALVGILSTQAWHFHFIDQYAGKFAVAANS